MKRIREIIEQNLSGKKVLLLFIVTNIVYSIMLLVTIPKTMSYSNGMKILDLKPLGYDPEYIITLFENLGERGRQVYLYLQLPVDMVYPFLFGVSYCLLMGYFLNKLNRLNSGYFYLCFLPLISGSADYLENFGIISMLIKYPNLAESLMYATNIFSIVKSMTTTVFFVVLIIILIMFGVKAIRNKKKS